MQAANGLPSAPVTVTLPPVAPPTSLVAQDFLGEARLTWDRVPGATGHHVFRQLQGEPGFTQLTTNPVIVQNNTAVYTFPGPEYTDQRAPKAQPVRYYVQAVDGVPSALVAVLIGIPRWSEVRKFSGSNDVFFNWGRGSGATSVQIQRSSSPTGAFAPLPATQYFNGEARAPGNPIDVPQYFKLVMVYSTGVTESPVIQVTVRSATTGGTCYGSVGANGGVTWQNYSC